MALFIALGGVASGLEGRATVNSGDVVNDTLKAKDVATEAVRSEEVRDQTLGPVDIAADAIGTGELLDEAVTPEKLGAVPAVRVEAPQEDPACVTQSVPSGNGEIVRWSLEAFDTANLHADPPAGCSAGTQTRLTAPIDGLYVVAAGIVWASDSDGRRQAEMILNGSGAVAGDYRVAVSGAATVQDVSTLLDLDAGDYVEVQAFQDGGEPLALTNSTSTFLAATWVGPPAP
jgi:hypothetical protein